MAGSPKPAVMPNCWPVAACMHACGSTRPAGLSASIERHYRSRKGAVDRSGLPVRQRRLRLFGIGQNAHPLLGEEILHGRAQPRMTQVVPGVGDHRFKTANQLVLALGTGIEALQTLGD